MEGNFEDYLINKGYYKHVFETKTMTYRLATHTDILSTLGNLDFRYYKEDLSGKSYKEVDRTKEIVWGLHEHHKPPCLISHRYKLGVIMDDEVFNYFETHNFDEIYLSLTSTNNV